MKHPRYRVTYTADSKRYGESFTAETHKEIKIRLAERVADGDRLTLERMSPGRWWQAEINNETVIADVWKCEGRAPH